MAVLVGRGTERGDAVPARLGCATSRLWEASQGRPGKPHATVRPGRSAEPMTRGGCSRLHRECPGTAVSRGGTSHTVLPCDPSRTASGRRPAASAAEQSMGLSRTAAISRFPTVDRNGIQMLRSGRSRARPVRNSIPVGAVVGWRIRVRECRCVSSRLPERGAVCGSPHSRLACGSAGGAGRSHEPGARPTPWTAPAV